MKFNKYINVLLKEIKEQAANWFDSAEEKMIPNTEVFRFLQSIKETAGTLELGDLHLLACDLLRKVNIRGEKEWEPKELNRLLNELIALTYSYGDFEEIDAKQELSRDEKIPLIQIIDDDISNLILLKDFLEKKGWMVITNSNPDKALSQFFDFNPDCVIIDVNLPYQNGFELMDELQTHSNKQFVPIIMIGSDCDRDTRINAFKMGADDFLGKPLDLEELAVHIGRHLQRKQVYDQTVMMDELTSVYNRRYLHTAFHRSLNDLKRRGQLFSLAILDLDFFKKINDLYGHLAGDQVLSGFASFLEDNTRGGDIVFRYGGEEFIILLQNADTHLATEMMNLLLHDFCQQRFTAGEEVLSLSFSAGICTVDTPETTLEAALGSADQALYRAKELGRARVECIHQLSAKYLKRKLYISVIDDDPIIRAILKETLMGLEIEHYETDIKVFENGLTFFNSHRLNQPGEHFLILDGIMPVMDGLEVLKKIKPAKGRKNVLIMMLTGRNSQTDIARALELGADDYMTKPFHTVDLQSRIKQLIQRLKK